MNPRRAPGVDRLLHGLRSRRPGPAVEGPVTFGAGGAYASPRDGKRFYRAPGR
jgi:hypothetical protein